MDIAAEWARGGEGGREGGEEMGWKEGGREGDSESGREKAVNENKVHEQERG